MPGVAHRVPDWMRALPISNFGGGGTVPLVRLGDSESLTFANVQGPSSVTDSSQRTTLFPVCVSI